MGEPLLDAGFRVGDAAVWLAEGLPFYLSETAVRSLFCHVSRLAKAGDALGVDFMVRRPPGVDAAKGFTSEDPSAMFEDCGWSASRCDVDEEGERLGRRGRARSSPSAT